MRWYAVTVDELRDAAKAIGVKAYKNGENNGKKQRLAITLASSPHKMLVLLLSHFKISKSSLPNAYALQPQLCRNWQTEAPSDNSSVPHPRWSAIFKDYPSGERKMYTLQPKYPRKYRQNVRPTASIYPKFPLLLPATSE